MIGCLVAAAAAWHALVTPTPNPSGRTPGPTSSSPVPTPASPLPVGAEASVADWLAAWAQVGAAVGTVLTLAAALWINRRTRLALDDERTARQQEIARLEAGERETHSQKVHTQVEELVDAAVAVRQAVNDHRVSITPSVLGTLSYGFGMLLFFLFSKGEDMEGDDGSLTPDGRLVFTMSMGLMAGGVYQWSRVTNYLPQTGAKIARVESVRRQLQSTAHPDLYRRVLDVAAAAQELAQISRQTTIRLSKSKQSSGLTLPVWPARRSEKADEDLLEAITALRTHIANGPLIP